MVCLYLSPIFFFPFTKHAIIGYVFWRFNVSKPTLWGLGNMRNQTEWDYFFFFLNGKEKEKGQ